MKALWVDYALGYIRFTLEAEGDEETSDDGLEIFRDIMEEETEDDDAVKAYLREHHLEKRPFEGDPESFYHGTRCPVNYFGIHDEDELDRVDLMLSSLRTAGLFVDKIDLPPDKDHYLLIHRRLFGDIYPSAGMLRDKDISKRTDFLKAKQIPRALNDIFHKLEATDYLKNLEDEDDFVYELAYLMGELEAIHPFWDGNGRTTRFFITRVAHRAGFMVDWGQTDADSLLEASISSIDGDNQPLIDLLEEITFPLEED